MKRNTNDENERVSEAEPNSTKKRRKEKNESFFAASDTGSPNLSRSETSLQTTATDNPSELPGIVGRVLGFQCSGVA